MKSEFEWDGSLRDLYVLEAGMEIWQKTLDLLRASGYPLSYLIDNATAEVPSDVTSIFRKRLAAGTVLTVDVQGITLHTHFFTEEVVEFDIDPREINSEARFTHLRDFMQRLGQKLGRDVFLTRETSGREVEEAIFCYSSASDDFIDISEQRNMETMP